jgi:hypothetical protein
MNDLSEILKYKDYPEGSGGKNLYDKYFLPINEYIKKYYANPEYKEWDTWYKKYIEPAFNETRHDEMVKNFGYVSKERHDFEEQYKVYSLLKDRQNLSEEVKQFIGFLAGAGFFKKYGLTVGNWFNSKNWLNPNLEEADDKMTINEILNIPYGINYFKVLLTQMPFWRR